MWWSDDLEIGVSVIDEQHKSIFTKANEIFEMGKDTDREDLKKSLDFLMKYTNTHFLDEEQLMIDSHYKDIMEHRRQHNLFVEEIYKIYLAFHSDQLDNEIFNDLKEMIIEWLAKHIKGADKDFIKHFINLK